MTLECEVVPLAERSLAIILQMFPQAVDVLDEAGILFCCYGARALRDAAAAAGYRPDELIARITARPPAANAIDWMQRPLADLTEYLTADHKRIALEAIPALRERIEREIHSNPGVPELRRMKILFDDMAASITMHMAHEERDLFPWIATAENPGTRGIRFGQRVLREHVEHKETCDQLRTLGELAGRVRIDHGELYAAVQKFASPIRQHIHLENNVLYPRVIEVENRSRQQVADSRQQAADSRSLSS